MSEPPFGLLAATGIKRVFPTGTCVGNAVPEVVGGIVSSNCGASTVACAAVTTRETPANRLRKNR